MPNISINRSDLKDLGINLKDILKVLSNTKDDEIKIKKIKKSKKKNKKNKKSRKDPEFNPFPKSNQPKFPQYNNAGGGGSHGPIINITNPVGKDNNDNDAKLEKLNEKLDKKFDKLQLQNQTTYNGLMQAGHALHSLMNNPPPLTYAYRPNLMTRNIPSPINSNDSHGVIANNNFYNNTNTAHFIDQDIDDSQNVDDSLLGQGTSNTRQQVELFDDSQLPLNDSLLGLNRQQEISIDEGIFPSEEEELPIENKQQNIFDLLKQDVKNAEKRKGRPKGSRNRPRHPLSNELLSQDYNTRTSGQTLINPQFQTPDTFVRRQSDSKMKQESIEKMFRKSSQLPSTTPIEEEKNDDVQDSNEKSKPMKKTYILSDSEDEKIEEEEPIPITTFNAPRTIKKNPNQKSPSGKIPTPPPKSTKPSGIQKPVKRRSRSNGDPEELG